MITDQMISRINELAKKKKTTGLTSVEQQEQQRLRRLYIDAFKTNLKSQLDNIEFVDEQNLKYRK